MVDAPGTGYAVIYYFINGINIYFLAREQRRISEVGKNDEYLFKIEYLFTQNIYLN